MSHYDCSRCGECMCTPSRCKARDERKAKELADKLERLGLPKADLVLLERALHVSELLLPDVPYSKGVILNELIGDLKKRIK